jgi:hypothetical protein
MLVKLAARSEPYAGTGTKKELYRQALSAGQEGSLRGGATRQALPVPRRAQHQSF